MEGAARGGRQRPELSPCPTSGLKAWFAQVPGVSDSDLKHFASLCSEVWRRPALSSGLLLLSCIHSCHKLSPGVSTCQSCRSRCAPTNPAGSLLLLSPPALPLAASRTRAQTAPQAAGRQSCSLTAASSEERAEQGEEREGKATRGQQPNQGQGPRQGWPGPGSVLLCLHTAHTDAV